MRQDLMVRPDSTDLILSETVGFDLLVFDFSLLRLTCFRTSVDVVIRLGFRRIFL